MSVIHAPTRPELEPRVLVFPVVLGGLFLALFLRLWYFQVVKSDELIAKAEQTGKTRVERLAPRGLIYDRNGVMLAGTRSKLVVTAVKSQVTKTPESMERVARILGVPEQKLWDTLNRTTWRPNIPAPIFVGAPLQQATKIAETADDLPGIDVSTQPMRFYPDGKSFAHLLGYVWVPSEKDLRRLEDKGVKAAAYVGKSGLEKEYEVDLMGQAGSDRIQTVVRDSQPKIIGRDAPVAGKKLTLTLDKNLQQLAFKMMAEKGFRGAAVALNPNNGEVLAMVSSPSYDTRLFLDGISQKDYQRILDDPTKPFVNRAISDGAPPGSTFKPLTAMAAQSVGQFSPSWSVDCRGGYRIGNRTLKCLGVHRSVNFQRALEKSCNTYFAALASRIGLKAMQETAAAAGFGLRTGIDTTGEWPGRVLSDEVVKRYRKKVIYYPGDLANFGIGQGELTATPLQMAVLASMIANRGTAYRPHLVRATQGAEESSPTLAKPEVLHRVEGSPQFWDTMQRAMVGVVENGTARGGKIPGFLWGGKTGSAEHGRFNEKRSHSWFIGYAPAQNPKIAIAVFVDSGGHGSESAMPICKALIEEYLLKNQGVANSASERSAASN